MVTHLKILLIDLCNVNKHFLQHNTSYFLMIEYKGYFIRVNLNTVSICSVKVILIKLISNSSKLQNYDGVTSSFEDIWQHYVRENFINIKQNK